VKISKEFSYFLIYIILLMTIFYTTIFSAGYYVRMVYETSKYGNFMRSEEVYESGDYKVVIVKAPESFVWVKIKDKYYIGNSNTLTRTFQIKDLSDIAYEYVKSKKLDISVDGVYKFVEEAFSIEVFVVSGEIMRIVRKVCDATTIMYINSFPKQFDIKSILAKYKLLDNTALPEEFFQLSKFFLWSSISEGKDYIRINGYDKEGKELEIEINKVSGDYKIGAYYLRIIRATNSTTKEIKNALRDN